MTNQEKILGIIRHILTMAGGVLVAIGWMEPDQVTELVATIMTAAGSVMTIIGFVMSWKAPEKNKN